MRRSVSVLLTLLSLSVLPAQQVDWVSGVRNKPMMDLRSYGAKCNGTADDTAAYNAAVAALGAEGMLTEIPKSCVINWAAASLPTNSASLTPRAAIMLINNSQPPSPVQSTASGIQINTTFRGTTVWSRANGKLTNITVAANVATVNLTEAHGLSAGTRVVISGVYADIRLNMTTNIATTPTSSSFTVNVLAAANGTYTDATAVVYPYLANDRNTMRQTGVYLTQFSTPDMGGDGSPALSVNTGAGGAYAGYKLVEMRPAGYEDYSAADIGIVEIGTSGADAAFKAIPGMCKPGGGTLQFDVVPWSIANGRLTNIVMLNGTATFNLTVAPNAPTGFLFNVTGSGVANLDGAYAIRSVTGNVLTAVRLDGAAAANGTYNGASTVASSYYGCSTPHISQGLWVYPFSPRTNGTVYDPYGVSIYGNSVLYKNPEMDQYYAWVIGNRVSEQPIRFIRGYAKWTGEVGGWRGSTETDVNGNSTPLSGVLKASSTRVTVANTVTPTLLGTVTIPANFPTVNRVLKLKAAGFYSQAGTDTLSITWYIAGVYGVSLTTAATPATDAAWIMEASVMYSSLGAAGTVEITGMDQIGSTSRLRVETAPRAIDTTTDVVMPIAATWAVADPGNSVTITQMTVEVVN